MPTSLPPAKAGAGYRKAHYCCSGCSAVGLVRWRVSNFSGIKRRSNLSERDLCSVSLPISLLFYWYSGWNTDGKKQAKKSRRISAHSPAFLYITETAAGVIRTISAVQLSSRKPGLPEPSQSPYPAKMFPVPSRVYGELWPDWH